MEELGGGAESSNAETYRLFPWQPPTEEFVFLVKPCKFQKSGLIFSECLLVSSYNIVLSIFVCFTFIPYLSALNAFYAATVFLDNSKKKRKEIMLISLQTDTTSLPREVVFKDASKLWDEDLDNSCWFLCNFCPGRTERRFKNDSFHTTSKRLVIF